MIRKEHSQKFKPDLTPKEMLELGVFGGLYFSDKPKEFPKNWFIKAKLSPDGKRHKELNFFGLNASQPLVVWQTKGWINPQDPRGWFQWYCRRIFFAGQSKDKPCSTGAMIQGRCN